MDGMEQNWFVLLAVALPLGAGLCALLCRKASLAWGAGLLGLGGSVAAAAVIWLRPESGGAWSAAWLSLPLPAAVPNAEGTAWRMLLSPLALNTSQLQLLMLLTTALVGIGVLLFAWRDRRGDPQAAHFFAVLTLFTASMLCFTIADSLLLLYIAWEAMGVCSYLLIAHPGTAEARRAARQAFWTTRATDTGLLFAIIILQGVFGVANLSGIDLQEMLTNAARAGITPETGKLWLGAAGLLILLAVLGKAAQWPLSFWLPDAMVAPAPVSALLHAATLVAAGPLLLVLVHQLFLAYELSLVALTMLGGVTLVSGAAMALCQRDPKRVLAYSTVSQLGLVIMAVGVLAEEAAVFHLVAHAWFKAALFLGVGFLMTVELPHGPAQEGQAATESEPLYALAGKAARYPLLLWCVLVPAGLSLAGLPWFAGGLGKEQVLFGLLYRAGTGPQGMLIGQAFPLAAKYWVVGAALFIISLPLTAAYTVRLLGILGWRRQAPASGAGLDALAQQTGAAGSAPAPARIPPGWHMPLVAAAVLALMGSAGLMVFFYGWFATAAGFRYEEILWKWSDGPQGAATLALALAGLALGGGLAWLLAVAKPSVGRCLARESILAPLAAYLRHGMFLREFFTTLIGRTGELMAIMAGIAEVSFMDWLTLRCGAAGRALGQAARWTDDNVVDRGRWFVCMLAWWGKALHARTMQTGRIQRYMFVVIVGSVLMCLAVLKPLGQRVLEILQRTGALGGGV